MVWVSGSPTWWVNTLSQNWGLHLNKSPSSFVLVFGVFLAVTGMHHHRSTSNFIWAPPERMVVFLCPHPSHWDAGWLCTQLPWCNAWGRRHSLASRTALSPKIEDWLPQVSVTDRYRGEWVCVYMSPCKCVLILQPLQQPFKLAPGKTLPIRELSNSENGTATHTPTLLFQWEM